MNKILALIIALILCLSLVACGGKDAHPPASGGQSDNGGISDTDGTDNPDTEDGDGIPNTDDIAVLTEGTCGESAAYTLYSNGVLTVSGTGAVSEKIALGDFYRYVEYITIEKGITSIETDAFTAVARDTLVSVELPSTIKSIGAYAFSGFSALKSINLPHGLLTVGKEAFAETGLTNLTLPGTVTEIAEGTFSGCDSLSLLVIPGSVKTIGKKAFKNCDGLKVVILLSGVESIGKKAFDCDGLNAIAIPESVTDIAEDAINGFTEVHCYEGSYAEEYFDGAIADYSTFARKYRSS